MNLRGVFMENVPGIFEGGLHLAFIGFVEEGIVLFIFSGKDEVFPAEIRLSAIYPCGKKLYRRNPE
jgi:hypothetical protein